MAHPIRLQHLNKRVADALREQAPQSREDLVDTVRACLIGPDEGIVAECVRDIVALGPLFALLYDDTVTEVMVNGPDRIFYEREGRRAELDWAFEDATALRAAMLNLLHYAPGKRLDAESPMVDLSIPSAGLRCNLTLPPATPEGPHMTVRKYRPGTGDLATLQALGSLSPEMADLLVGLTRARANVLMSGATGSGKTTLLEAMARHIAPDERIVVLEDALELSLPQPNVVRMLTRDANIEGRGRLTTRDLFRNTLRMRPDRIVLGELRGPEALDFVQALSSGHDGSMAVLHAGSAAEALLRMEHLAALSQPPLPPGIARREIAAGLDVVVQTALCEDKVRRVTEIATPVLRGEELDVRVLWRWSPERAAFEQVHELSEALKDRLERLA